MNATEAIVEFSKLLKKEKDLGRSVGHIYRIIDYLKEAKGAEPYGFILVDIQFLISPCIQSAPLSLNLVEAFKVLHRHYLADKISGLFAAYNIVESVDELFKEFYRVHNEEGV